MNSDQMSFGSRLQTLRERSELTQKQLAEHLQVTPQAYSQYERDQRRPDFETLVRIADFYHVSLDYLLLGEQSLPSWEELGIAEAADLPPQAQRELREYAEYLCHKYRRNTSN